MNAHSQCLRNVVASVIVGAALLALSVGVEPAGAVVAQIGGQNFGVTPIRDVDTASLSGAYRSRRSSRLSAQAGARNFDGPPFGGSPLEYLGGPVMHSTNTM